MCVCGVVCVCVSEWCVLVSSVRNAYLHMAYGFSASEFVHVHHLEVVTMLIILRKACPLSNC